MQEFDQNFDIAVDLSCPIHSKVQLSICWPRLATQSFGRGANDVTPRCSQSVPRCGSLQATLHKRTSAHNLTDTDVMPHCGSSLYELWARNRGFEIGQTGTNSPLSNFVCSKRVLYRKMVIKILRCESRQLRRLPVVTDLWLYFYWASPKPKQPLETILFASGAPVRGSRRRSGRTSSDALTITSSALIFLVPYKFLDLNSLSCSPWKDYVDGMC